MGGKLFNTKRLPLNEFNIYRNHMENMLQFFGIEYKIPLYFRNKEDFGDLDVLIKKTVPTNKLLNIFRFYESHYDKSEAVVSFNYKDFQVDFIKIEPENFDIAFHYYSYNDLGNLIGQLAKINHLKFGFDGLKYNHYVNGQKKGTIYVSKNIDEILTFLDLDKDKFNAGFDTIEDVFDYVIKSKYFNPYISDLEPYGFNSEGVALYRINKINRERNTKRKTYQLWLEYIKKFKTGEENYKFRDESEESLNEIYDRINDFFPNIHFKDKLEKIQIEEEERNNIKKKFNGNIIIELLPDLDIKDRSSFIDSFKNEISKNKEFEKYISENEQDAINKDIINYFETFKLK